MGFEPWIRQFTAPGEQVTLGTAVHVELSGEVENVTVELNVPVVEKVTRQLTHGVFPLKLATLFPAESP